MSSFGVLIDSIYVLIILNPIHSLFQLFVQNVVYFFIFYVWNLPTFKCLKQESMKLEYNFFCLQADTLFFLLMSCMFRYSYNKIYINEYLNRDIVVYLKYDVKFT